MPLSVVIHTKNAAKTLKTALESVKFADEVVIIDMHSTDDTVALAKKYTNHIFTHDDVGYADPARNFGLSKAHSEWILVLDADEEVSPGLSSFIKKLLVGEAPTDQRGDSYYLPRKNLIFNQWIKHTGWWPDYQLRLFKKGSVSWENGVHKLAKAQGENVVFLSPDEDWFLIHHNYQTITQFIDRLNRYTTIKADEEEKGRSLHEAEVIKTFGNEFISRLFARQGIKDGAHGVSLSLLQAMYEVVVKLKIWEKQEFPTHVSEEKTIQGLRQFQQDLNYWLADWQVNHTSGLQQWWWRFRRKYHR